MCREHLGESGAQLASLGDDLLTLTLHEEPKQHERNQEERPTQQVDEPPRCPRAPLLGSAAARQVAVRRSRYRRALDGLLHRDHIPAWRRQVNPQKNGPNAVWIPQLAAKPLAAIYDLF